MTTPIEAGAAAIDVEMDSQGIWGLATNEDLTKAVFESIDEDRLMDVLIVHTESVRGGCICGWESHDMAADIPGHQAREIKAWLNGGS